MIIIDSMQTFHVLGKVYTVLSSKSSTTTA